MNIEEAIDILHGIKDGTACLMKDMPKRGEIAIDMAINALSEQRWTPVAEGLPKERYYNDSDYVEPSDSVLVFTRYKTYYISRYWGHRTTKGESNYVIPDWMDLDEYISDAVIAWTPLPEEYRG